MQYCDGFCRTLIWISHRHTRVPSLLNPPPISPHLSRLSQSTGFGFPVSYIRIPLAICLAYANVYVSILFSQSIPPSPSPTVSWSLFFMSVKGSKMWCFDICTHCEMVTIIRLINISVTSHRWVSVVRTQGN